MEDANLYLSAHRIGELMENMTAQLVFHKPSTRTAVFVSNLGDPRKFLIDYLENLKEVRDGKGKPRILFDEQNCLALFRVFDRSGAGYISMAQYEEGVALKNLF